MKISFHIRWLFIFMAILSLNLSWMQSQAAPPARLKVEDIGKIMKEIFSEHVEERAMTPALMRNAIQLYIDQFDADRTYLLESEVNPYENMSDSALKTNLEKLERNDYSVFEKLSELFHQSILRARTLRHLSEHNRSALFDEAAKTIALANPPPEEAPDTALGEFENSPEGLKKRWHNLFLEGVRNDMAQYGINEVRNKQQHIVEGIEENLRAAEIPYLGSNQKNESLPADEQKHFFTLHVLKALASSLDPHTAFFDNSEAFEMKKNLDKGYEGIGIVFAENPDGFIVNDLVPNSPAAKSDLVKPKDQILSINGQKLEGKSLREVTELIRGHHDEAISLLLRRQTVNSKPSDQMIEVRLKTQMITLDGERVDSGFEPYQGGILGWVTLHSFYEGENGVNSADDLAKAISELKTHGELKGLILDLRDNGGGYLTQAVKVAGLFISDGVVVISKYNDGTEKFYRDIHPEFVFDGPLIILTSRLTASAAEIVAQALQDYGVGLVVGDDRTYGKGTIQAQTVTDGHSTSYFKVTVGKYYTVSGRTTQISGVKSDIEVPGRYSKLHVGEEYLKEALPNDSIAPAFDDGLVDLDPLVRDWYMRYYIPDLQKPVIKWREQLTQLRQRSTQRIKGNATYQAYITNPQYATSKGTNGESKNDLQLSEGLNILKDMNQVSRRPSTVSASREK